MIVKLDDFPKDRVENKTYLKPPPRIWTSNAHDLIMRIPSRTAQLPSQLGSRYGIFTYNGSISMVNVGKYTYMDDGSYGIPSHKSFWADDFPNFPFDGDMFSRKFFGLSSTSNERPLERPQQTLIPRNMPHWGPQTCALPVATSSDQSGLVNDPCNGSVFLTPWTQLGYINHLQFCVSPTSPLSKVLTVLVRCLCHSPTPARPEGTETYSD